MEIAALIEKLTLQPEQVEFQEVIATIDENFDFTPTAFVNGETVNAENQNNGSCKIFAFAQLQELSVEQCNCFLVLLLHHRCSIQLRHSLAYDLVCPIKRLGFFLESNKFVFK